MKGFPWICSLTLVFALVQTWRLVQWEGGARYWALRAMQEMVRHERTARDCAMDLRRKNDELAQALREIARQRERADRQTSRTDTLMERRRVFERDMRVLCPHLARDASPE